MINIIKKEDCVGCNGCLQICPKRCIAMQEDEQGFLYPEVDAEQCINCGLCEKVCPVINQYEPTEPLYAYAAKNVDTNIQNTSSSGGVFYALTEKVINGGGLVVGARFNENWEVVHDYSETLEGVRKFQRSKYVQSKIGDPYIKAREFLNQDRKVLFSGTPCQIAGLKRFLRKDYVERLIAVDIACHGVPSPKIWLEYLDEITSSMSLSKDSISQINFRDKRYGWDKYGMSITFEKKSKSEEYFSPMHQNIYRQGFLKNLYLRPSCYACPAKCGKSQSDLTLADFWGINNFYIELYNEGYYSLVLSKTEGGDRELKDLTQFCKSEVSYEKAIKGNPALVSSSTYPHYYKDFWQKYISKGISGLKEIIKRMRPSFFERLKSKIMKIIKRYLS